MDQAPGGRLGCCTAENNKSYRWSFFFAIKKFEAVKNVLALTFISSRTGGWSSGGPLLGRAAEGQEQEELGMQGLNLQMAGGVAFWYLLLLEFKEEMEATATNLSLPGSWTETPWFH